jgi:hypothetical protein
MTRRHFIRPTLGMFAAAGLVGAHVLAYLIALPDAAVRAAVLRTTGHGYFSAAFVVATVAAIFGSAAAAAIGCRRGHTASSLRWRAAAWRIALVQSTAFLVLEFAERAAADVPFSLSPKLLGIGLAVQLVVAIASAVVVVLIARVAALVWIAWSRRPRPTARLGGRAVALFDGTRPRAAFATGVSARGPPSPH